MTEQSNTSELCARIAQLGPAPVAVRILEILKNDKAPVQRLAGIVGADPVFAARMLRIANFATNLPHGFSTLYQAITALGFDTVKSLALGLSAFSMRKIADSKINSESDPGELPITLRQLWEHSLGCAAVAGRLAAKVDHLAPHQVFVAGFLHDIGKVLMFLGCKDNFLEAVSVARDKMIPLSEAETLALGMNHRMLGEIWARQNELLYEFQQVIHYHHEPLSMLPESMDRETRSTIVVVHLADLLCETSGIGSGGDDGSVPSELWMAVNLRQEGWADSWQAIKQEIEATSEMFGFPVPGMKRMPSLPRAVLKPENESVAERPKMAVNAPRGQVIAFPGRGAIADRGPDKPLSKKLTILVVEDHGSLCDMLSLYFMRNGYHVRTANNGEIALEILAKEEIDLILLDLMLPRLDGFAVLKQIREAQKAKNPYVIVVSAGASEKDRRKVLDLGANEYMPKPFQLARLLERVQAVEKFLL